MRESLRGGGGDGRRYDDGPMNRSSRRSGLRERGRYVPPPRGAGGGERLGGGDRSLRIGNLSLSNGERDLRLLSLISNSRRRGDLGRSSRSSLRSSLLSSLLSSRLSSLLSIPRSSLRGDMNRGGVRRIGLRLGEMRRMGLLGLLRLRRHRSPPPPSLSLDLSRLKRSALRDRLRGDLPGT